MSERARWPKAALVHSVRSPCPCVRVERSGWLTVPPAPHTLAIPGKSSTLKLKAASAEDAHDWGMRIKEAIENAPPEMDPETAKFMAEHAGDMAPKFTNQTISTGSASLGGRRRSSDIAAAVRARHCSLPTHSG